MGNETPHPVAVAQADDGKNVAPPSVEVPGPDDWNPDEQNVVKMDARHPAVVGKLKNDAVMKELAKPFPKKYIQENPSGGGSYVTHSIVKQRLIQVLGQPPCFELVQIVRGDVAEKEPTKKGQPRPHLTNVVVGVVARLTVTINGKTIIEEDAGDCEDPHNWPHDGARMKDAMSDAYKRCAANLGLGLHLWSKQPGDYFLYDVLSREA